MQCPSLIGERLNDPAGHHDLTVGELLASQIHVEAVRGTISVVTADADAVEMDIASHQIAPDQLLEDQSGDFRWRPEGGPNRGPIGGPDRMAGPA